MSSIVEEDGRFLVRQWADGCVVLDRRFGDTHALSPISAAVFKLIRFNRELPESLLPMIQALFPDLAVERLASEIDGAIDSLSVQGLLDQGDK